MTCTPPAAPVDTRKALSILVDTINGRAIRKYMNVDGRLIYVVGRVGFYHLDEARIYAKGGPDAQGSGGAPRAGS